MSSWTASEKLEFHMATTGQITLDTAEGQHLFRILREYPLKAVVEIGTWNGLGSTLCLIQGCKGTKTSLWSLECNEDKHEAAKRNLESLLSPDIHLLHGTVVDADDFMINYDYLEEFGDDIVYEWLKADLTNCKAAPNSLAVLPESIDLLLLDGGEYTSTYEFITLFPRCKRFIALDDIFTAKNRRVRSLLLEHPDWKEIVLESSRNGFCIFEKT